MFFKTDAEKGDGPALAKAYGVVGYPTFVVLNASRQTLHRWSGYSRDHFLTRAGETIADPTTIEEKQARFARRPTEADAAVLARYHDSRGEYAEAVAYFHRAQSISSRLDAYLMPILESSFYGVRRKVVTWDDLLAAADRVLAAPATPPEDLILAARLAMAAAGDDPARREATLPHLRGAVERTEGSTDAEVVKARARVLPEYALRVEKDAPKAVAAMKATLSEGWQEDAQELNRFAWWCFENNVNLAEAERMAARGVELAAPGPGRAMILDTLAEIENARGDCGAAVTHIEAALADDPGNEYSEKQLDRFEALRAEKGQH